MLILLVVMIWILLNQKRGFSWKNGLWAGLVTLVIALASTAIMMANMPAVGQ